MWPVPVFTFKESDGFNVYNLFKTMFNLVPEEQLQD